MGERFEFVCDKCGYRVEVSGGGDAGEMAVTNTIVCESCRCLYDVVVLDMTKSPPVEQVERCPRSAKHKIAIWKRGGLCPKCAAPMATGNLTILWD